MRNYLNAAFVGMLIGGLGFILYETARGQVHGSPEQLPWLLLDMAIGVAVACAIAFWLERQSLREHRRDLERRRSVSRKWAS